MIREEEDCDVPMDCSPEEGDDTSRGGLTSCDWGPGCGPAAVVMAATAEEELKGGYMETGRGCLA